MGERPAATHAAIQVPWAALHARIAAGTAAPPVETPATPPPADTQATQSVLHPVWQIPYASGPDWAIWINMANMTIYFTTDAILLKVNDQAK